MKNVDEKSYDDFFQNINTFIYDKNIKMIIVDSFAALADVRFISEDNSVDYIARANFMKSQISLFKELISKYFLFFFVVNNVKSDFEKGSGVK